MKKRRAPRFWQTGLALVLLAGLAACGGAEAESPDVGAAATYPVETVFEEFYRFLGGAERMGPALSPIIYEGEVQKQYLRNGLLVFDPSLPPSEQYSLAPIGASLGVRDEPLNNPGLPGTLFVEGYIIYEGFADLYQAMGGQRYVGLPLTGVRFLAEQNRVEQYFENLGFYLNLADEDASVKLMNYGQVACGGSCGSNSAPAAIIQIDLPYGEPFVSTVGALGDAVVGERLAGPYQTADGSIEVIYRNLVLYAQSSTDVRATARPILARLGVAPEPMVPRLDNANLMFYGLSGDLGYNVPLVFNDYIAQHGGYEIFGQPISEFKLLEDGGFRQCYANACLRYSGGQVAPLPMGAEYKAALYDQPVTSVQGDAAIQIQVWEDRGQISSAEQQVIHASLFRGTQLLEGLRPYLNLTLPSGGVSVYQFPPTDASGQTQVTVPAVVAQNGTLVAYQVCLESIGLDKVCASDSYMIWGNP